MPAASEEFTAGELGWALAESRWAADGLLGLAWDLEVKLPGTNTIPGSKLRHLAQIRHATCTGPTCRRPST